MSKLASPHRLWLSCVPSDQSHNWAKDLLLESQACRVPTLSLDQLRRTALALVPADESTHTSSILRFCLLLAAWWSVSEPQRQMTL